MSLNTTAKDWLATNAGSANCIASSGISYKDADGVSHVGSTGDVANAFWTAHSVGKDNVIIIAGTSYATRYIGSKTIPGFKSINGGNDIDLTDVDWVYNHDAPPSQYCAETEKICIPGTRRCIDATHIEQCSADGMSWNIVDTCGTGFECRDGECVSTVAKPTTPPMEVTIAEGVQCPPGAPTVVLDVTEARPYFKTDPLLYVGVMGIDVTNQDVGNHCFGYFVWEMKMWPGEAGTTCPTTDPMVQEISRFLATKSDWKTISPQLLGTNEKGMIGGSFEIPAGTHGTYTLCLSLWGNHDKKALLDELAAAGYPEKIAWP